MFSFQNFVRIDSTKFSSKKFDRLIEVFSKKIHKEIYDPQKAREAIDKLARVEKLTQRLLKDELKGIEIRELEKHILKCCKITGRISESNGKPCFVSIIETPEQNRQLLEKCDEYRHITIYIRPDDIGYKFNSSVDINTTGIIFESRGGIDARIKGILMRCLPIDRIQSLMKEILGETNAI